jgi:hypothetical protein
LLGGIDMNHLKTYLCLIEKARGRARIPGVYQELHHVIPRCLGGSDDPSNLVLLTAKEHFLAHALLCFIHPGDGKVLSAFHLMRVGKRENWYRTSQEYATLREQFADSRRGVTISAETRAKMSAAAKERVATTGGEHLETARQRLKDPQVRAKMSETHKKRQREPRSSETKEKISASLTGRVFSAETRKKMSDSSRRRKGSKRSPEAKKRMAESQRQRRAREVE